MVWVRGWWFVSHASASGVPSRRRLMLYFTVADHGRTRGPIHNHDNRGRRGCRLPDASLYGACRGRPVCADTPGALHPSRGPAVARVVRHVATQGAVREPSEPVRNQWDACWSVSVQRGGTIDMGDDAVRRSVPVARKMECFGGRVDASCRPRRRVGMRIAGGGCPA